MICYGLALEVCEGGTPWATLDGCCGSPLALDDQSVDPLCDGTSFGFENKQVCTLIHLILYIAC